MSADRLDALAQLRAERDTAREYVASLHGAKSYEQLVETQDENKELRAERDTLRETLEYIRADPRLPFRLKRIADDALPSPRDAALAPVPDEEQA